MSGQDKQVEQNDNLFEEQNSEQPSNKPEASNQELGKDFDDFWKETLGHNPQENSSETELNSQQSNDRPDKDINSFVGGNSQASANESEMPYFDWLDFSLEDDDEVKSNTKNDNDNLRQDELATVFDFDLNDGENATIESNSELDASSENNFEIDSFDSFDNLEEFLDLESNITEDPLANLANELELDLPTQQQPQPSQPDSQFDELNDLIDEPALLFDDLAALIDENETANESPENSASFQPELEETSQTPTFNSVADDFLDLESLLQEEIPAKSKSSASVKPSNKANVPAPVADRKTGASSFEQTMRVPVKTLDNLSNLIGELVVKRNRLEEDQDRLRQFLDNLLNHVQSLNDVGARMHDLYERSLLEGALMASRQAYQNSSGDGSRQLSSSFGGNNNQGDDDLNALELDRFTGFHLLSQDIIELIVRVRESSSDIQFLLDETDKVTQTLRQVTSQLQDGINSSRMVSFGQTADRLPRAVRDISMKLNKQAELNIEGQDVLIDKMIVENLYNPMTHLVNNAMTHGIESPEERSQKGKESSGKIVINAYIQGNQTVISVSDDGAGIDPERVKAKAIEKGLIFPAQAENLSIQDIYEFLFHPGFSTRDKADDFAGRGVGMDVVRTDLRKIRGTVSIDSTIGKGTTFTIRLPLFLSISKALSCLSDRTRIAFPIDGVEDTKEYSPNDIQTNAQGLECLPWRGNLLPFQPLSNMLSYNRQMRRGSIYSKIKDDDTLSIIVLRSGGNLLAVSVDRIFGEQEIVIKQIEGPVPKPPGIAGATILGDGSIMAIGDVLELIEIAQGRRGTDIGANLWQLGGGAEQAEPEIVKTEPLVLVVDDSITVRELLTLSFSKLGYRVEQARDGQEAWDKLRGGLPADMIFCDIEMPRMNGLELLSHLKKEDNLKNIPVAMLTSRGAEKHRKLATDLGASAYLTKPYTEKDLIDVAQRFIKNDATATVTEETKKVTAVGLEPESSSPLETKSVSKSTSDLVVLIIDDSVTVRELLSMTFRKAGYHVEQARDGQEAWDKLRGGLYCDIAFCDIEMPRMNGLELLSRLQEDEKLSTLPIAMLTSRGAQKMKNIAAKRGAKGYFVKPYVEDTLLDAAQRMINGEVLLESINLEDLDKSDDED
jgi:chemosensory pili system protein ChpA (sensor histidine kinase/response regulator)